MRWCNPYYNKMSLCGGTLQACLMACVALGYPLQGKMTVFVGGDKEVFEKNRPLLEASFPTIL